MSVIANYHLESFFQRIDQTLHTLRNSQDVIPFFHDISSLTQIFAELETSVRNQRNAYGTQLPSSLIVHVVQFLPAKDWRCRFVCKSWAISLVSPLADRLLPKPEFYVNQLLDVLDTINRWLPARVSHICPSHIKVHYLEYNKVWDQVIDIPNSRIAEFCTRWKPPHGHGLVNWELRAPKTMAWVWDVFKKKL